jgi:hypothetical protein
MLEVEACDYKEVNGESTRYKFFQGVEFILRF